VVAAVEIEDSMADGSSILGRFGSRGIADSLEVAVANGPAVGVVGLDDVPRLAGGVVGREG